MLKKSYKFYKNNKIKTLLFNIYKFIIYKNN